MPQRSSISGFNFESAFHRFIDFAQLEPNATPNPNVWDQPFLHPVINASHADLEMRRRRLSYPPIPLVVAGRVRFVR
jgi:hypothetical protein